MQTAGAVALIGLVFLVLLYLGWRKAAPKSKALKGRKSNEDARMIAFLAPVVEGNSEPGALKGFPQVVSEGSLLPGPTLPTVIKPGTDDNLDFFGGAVKATPERTIARPAGPGSPETAAYRTAVTALAVALKVASEDVERAAASSSDPAESSARIVGAVTAAFGTLPVRQVITAAHAAARTGSISSVLPVEYDNESNTRKVPVNPEPVNNKDTTDGSAMEKE